MDHYEPMKEIPEVSRMPEDSKSITYRFLIQFTDFLFNLLFSVIQKNMLKSTCCFFEPDFHVNLK